MTILALHDGESLVDALERVTRERDEAREELARLRLSKAERLEWEFREQQARMKAEAERDRLRAVLAECRGHIVGIDADAVAIGIPVSLWAEIDAALVERSEGP